MLYDLQKHVFFFLIYNKTASMKAVQRAYQAEYNCKSTPTTKVIKNIVLHAKKLFPLLGKKKQQTCVPAI